MTSLHAVLLEVITSHSICVSMVTFTYCLSKVTSDGNTLDYKKYNPTKNIIQLTKFDPEKFWVYLVLGTLSRNHSQKNLHF